ncbi:hypothetical protein SLEP1_g2847 [Rubroshorea leprosula]|uniref:Uncharacterized protein n=1 Tax=Rubroshorea leprosula TaxID=152421 RepID=A0AAV5HS67_9ROSI|nr:hypothetical protein SLEP1_g2847 [Rubroshorea leprosula]
MRSSVVGGCRRRGVQFSYGGVDGRGGGWTGALSGRMRCGGRSRRSDWGVRIGWFGGHRDYRMMGNWSTRRQHCATNSWAVANHVIGNWLCREVMRKGGIRKAVGGGIGERVL